MLLGWWLEGVQEYTSFCKWALWKSISSINRGLWTKTLQNAVEQIETPLHNWLSHISPLPFLQVSERLSVQLCLSLCLNYGGSRQLQPNKRNGAGQLSCDGRYTIKTSNIWQGFGPFNFIAMECNERKPVPLLSTCRKKPNYPFSIVIQWIDRISHGLMKIMQFLFTLLVNKVWRTAFSRCITSRGVVDFQLSHFQTGSHFGYESERI